MRIINKSFQVSNVANYSKSRMVIPYVMIPIIAAYTSNSEKGERKILHQLTDNYAPKNAIHNREEAIKKLNDAGFRNSEIKQSYFNKDGGLSKEGERAIAHKNPVNHKGLGSDSTDKDDSFLQNVSTDEEDNNIYKALYSKSEEWIKEKFNFSGSKKTEIADNIPERDSIESKGAISNFYSWICEKTNYIKNSLTGSKEYNLVKDSEMQGLIKNKMEIHESLDDFVGMTPETLGESAELIAPALDEIVNNLDSYDGVAGMVKNIMDDIAGL